MLEPKQRAHPHRAADAGDAESFAAQILSAFDVGPRYEIVSIAAGKSGHDFQIMTAAIAASIALPPVRPTLNVTRRETGHQGGRAAQINRLGIDDRI